jgi:hypothetical protein
MTAPVIERAGAVSLQTWRAKQKPVPNLSEAIRRLVELGQKAKK